MAKQPPSVSNCQKVSYKYLNWPWSKRIGFSHFKTWLLPMVFRGFPMVPMVFQRFPMVFPSHFAPKDLATYDLVHLRRHGLAGANGETAMAEPWRSALQLCIRMDQVGSAGSLVLEDHPFKTLVVLGLNPDLDGVFIDVLPWLPWKYGDFGGVGYGQISFGQTWKAQKWRMFRAERENRLQMMHFSIGVEQWLNNGSQWLVTLRGAVWHWTS